MLNQCNFIGNLASDPELRYTQSGKSVCNFTLAANSGYGDNRRTEWVKVVCWGNTAEACGKYLKKGKRVFVCGEQATRKWTDKNGNDRYVTEIIASNVQFLSPKGEDLGDGNSSGNNSGYGGNDGDSYSVDSVPF